MITDGTVKKKLPCILTIDGCDVSISTVEQAERFGWAAYVAPTLTPMTEEEIRLAAIPGVITMRQARIALSRAGLLDDVATMVSALGGEAKIVWEYSSEVQRSNPLVGMVAAQAGWTESQLDDLFTQAAAL